MRLIFSIKILNEAKNPLNKFKNIPSGMFSSVKELRKMKTGMP
jgi:hypothetical protein